LGWREPFAGGKNLWRGPFEDRNPETVIDDLMGELRRQPPAPAGEKTFRRQLPESGEPAFVRGALDQEEPGTVAQQGELERNVARGVLLQLDGKLGFAARGAGIAEWRDRTFAAARRARNADRSAQLHHGLIEIAGTAAVEQKLRGFGKAGFGDRRGNLAGVAGDAANHAHHVAI